MKGIKSINALSPLHFIISTSFWNNYPENYKSLYFFAEQRNQFKVLKVEINETFDKK